MSDVVLIHGAWHGAWCWDRVRPLLERSGCRVFTPCLSGVGERAEERFRGLGLSDHINDVLRAVLQSDSKVILCGHSYGGTLISAVADIVPEKISALVYMDAFVPETGENLEHLIRNEVDGWLMSPLPAAYFNVNPDDRAMVDSKCTMQPSKTWRDRLCLTAPAGASVARKLYVAADGWAPTFRRDAERAEAMGWQLVHVPCGHELELDMPERTAELILSVFK